MYYSYELTVGRKAADSDTPEGAFVGDGGSGRIFIRDEKSRNYAAKENKGFEIMVGEFGWSEFEKPLGKPALGQNAPKS